MADYWDVVQWHEGRNKRFTQKIGSATQTKEGGFYVTFRALPVPTMRDGRIEIQCVIQPQYQKPHERARDDAPRQQQNDDDIPF